MFDINIVCFMVAILIIESQCWVFNNVDFRALKAKNLDVFEDLDLTKEVDEDMIPLERFNLIYPGTKWCGAGDVADSYDDLGPARETDMCCRDHDKCPDVIPAGETKHNITNDAFYSRLACDCDEKFRSCLRAVGSRTSTVIGKMYFNAIGTQCYREDYPITGCKRKGGWFNSKCVEYEYDTNGKRLYQWFDVPNY